MADVVRKHGGPRPNSGGARPGAGRPRKAPADPALIDGRDPLEFLLDTMQGLIAPTPAQLRAAEALLPYKYAKREAIGKKGEREEKAKEVAQGRFAPAAPPRLVANG